MNPILSIPVKRFLKQTFLAGLLLSLSVYAWVRVIFYEVPFSIAEDGTNLLKTVSCGWLITMVLRAACHMLIYIADNIEGKRLLPVYRKQGVAALLLISAVSVVLYACNAQASGIHKDMNTGLVTTYKGVTTSGTKMVMNDEVLNHTDIPIGESFVITNENVKGLTVKGNKVSVGCSLQITDSKGEVLLWEPDLFKGNDVFDKVDYLKCTVNTGQPMKWEEKYHVYVVFSDKYGTGRIENKVTIRAIDMP